MPAFQRVFFFSKFINHAFFYKVKKERCSIDELIIYFATPPLHPSLLLKEEHVRCK